MAKRDNAVTSILSYRGVDFKGKRALVIQTLLDMKFSGEVTSRENIAKNAGMKESSACGRINELRHLGVLEIGVDVRGNSGKWVETYKLVEAEPGQQTLLQE